MRICTGGAQYSVGDSRLNRELIFWVLTKANREVRHGGFNLSEGVLNQLRVKYNKLLSTTRTPAGEGTLTSIEGSRHGQDWWSRASGRDSSLGVDTIK